MIELSQRLTDRSTPLQIHLIGVAGSGMSGLALLLLGMGHKVSGSDKVTTAETERMQGVGLIFSSPPSAAAVKKVDMVVYSSAIKPANPAYAAAKKAKTPPEWAMFKYVDGSTKRNSKSQYMQILGSTKVKPGCEHDGRFFKKEGIFDCDGQLMDYLHLSDEMFYAATSMVIHDPWSIPFKTSLPEISSTPPNGPNSLSLLAGKKRKTAATTKTVTSTKIAKQDETTSIARFGNLASWDKLPPEPRKWMKGFIDGSFSADLRYIPAMSKPNNWCDDVMRLVNTGRGKLLVYAYVDNPAVCPRFLKIKGTIHTHSNKHCVLMCAEETHPSCTSKNYRMFVRCFSPKCNELKSPQHKAGWIEVIYDDYLKLLSLSSRQPPPPPP